MLGRALASAVVALVALAPLPSGAIESARPLRSLTFEVEISVSNTVETPGATLSNGPGAAIVVKGGRVIGRGAPIQGNGDKHSADSFATKGVIRIDVLMQTADSGLVVEIAEDAAPRVHPKVRVGVASDGELLYDRTQARDLSEEELAVVRWLARGFYGDHPTEIGTSWTVDQSANGRTDVERYRVVARQERRVTLEYALDERIERVGGYTGLREGSLVYDTALIVPVKGSFDSIARRQLGDQFATQRSSVRFVLTSDSFARK